MDGCPGELTRGEPEMLAFNFKALQAICAWCIGLRDPSIHDYLRRNTTIVEVLSHVADARKLGKNSWNGMAEFFGGPNGGWTVGRQILAAWALGLRVIINADNHHGNGRDEDGGSATGAGKYHGTPPTEGGFTHWLSMFLQWPTKFLDPVVAIQLGNEVNPTKKSNEWVVQFLRNNAGRIRAKGWKIIVDQFQARALVAAGLGHLFDIVDPHIFNLEPAGAKQFIRDLRAEFPGKLIWVTEALDPHKGHQAAMSRAILAGGATGISYFSGNTIGDFFDDIFHWDFRTFKPAATAFTDIGETVRGTQHEEVVTEFGIGGGSGPVDPPIEPDPPIDHRRLALGAVRSTTRRVEDGIEDDAQFARRNGNATRLSKNILAELAIAQANLEAMS